jgi:transglutaminase-like putative cysteine protease
MRLTLSHRTEYVFDPPVRRVIQSHRLHPADSSGQKVISWNVEAEGARFGSFIRDAAGDRLRTMTMAGPVAQLQVQVSGEVETSDRAGVLSGLAETAPPKSYLRETPLTVLTAAIRDLFETEAGSATELSGSSALSLAHDLSALVSDRIVWRPGATHAATSADEALAHGEGVCQDHAHLLIALARAAGLPGRYASGYLFARADGQAETAGHAWAELWIEGLGWVGFDPSNRCCPDERYIRLGSGADAQEAAPIRGQARGNSRESLAVAVAVSESQQ